MICRKVGTAVVCAVCLTLLAAPRVEAQATAIDEVRKDYRMHVGGLYFSPSLALTELGVDSNVFNETGERRSDFVLALTPRLDVALPIARRALLKATFGTGLNYFARYGSERSVDPQVVIRGELYAARLTPFAEVSYLNSRRRINLELDARERHKQITLTGGVRVRVTPKLSLHVSERHSETRFDDEANVSGQRLQDTLNSSSRAFTVSARRQLTALTGVSIDYEHQQDNFPLSPERNTKSFRISPGVTFKPRALINGTARIGYRKLDPVDPRLRAQSGLASALELSYTLVGETVFKVLFNRDYVFSYSASSPYFVDTGVGASVRRAVGPHFDLLAEAVRHRYHYERLSGASIDPLGPARVETTDQYGLSLGYRVRRQTRIGFGVSQVERRAPGSTVRNYRGLRFMATVSSSVIR